LFKILRIAAGSLNGEIPGTKKSRMVVEMSAVEVFFGPPGTSPPLCVHGDTCKASYTTDRDAALYSRKHFINKNRFFFSSTDAEYRFVVRSSGR